MNPLRSFFHAASAIGLLTLGASACAQTQAYAPKTRTIRAAVLLLDADKPDTATYGQTAAPYAFQNLDQASTIKPGGWTFTNPFAPGSVTTENLDRAAELGATDAAPLGAYVTKSYAAYWTMRLSQLSDIQMSSYDVLLIAPRQRLSLNPTEREKLRRFVDGGGVLWVDTSGPGETPQKDIPNNLPFAVQSAPASGNAYSDPQDPLLNGPRKVTGNDLTLLNRSGGLGLIKPYNGNPPTANERALVGEFSRYRGAAWVGNSPVVASARLGDGAIVVTARGAAEYLSQGNAGANLGFRNAVNSANGLGATARAAARLAVNIVSLGSNYQQPAGGSHKQGSASADPGSPVLSRFTAEGVYGPGNAIGQGVPVGSPVTYKGFLVASIHDVANNNYRVVVFDAVPGRDLDGDGDPDDGIVNNAGVVQDAWRDTSIGRSLDVVWISQAFPSPISVPVCAETPEAGGGDVVLVVDSTGRLNGFNLSPKSAQQRLIGGADHTPTLQVSPPDENKYATANLSGEINPPTVYDGIAYVADSVPATSGIGAPGGTPLPNGQTGVGRIWAVKLDGNVGSNAYMQSVSTGAGNTGYWFVGGATVANGTSLPAFTASPTIGYIPIQDSAGGVDRVLYAPGYVNASPQPAFVSLWLGAKGEKPFSVQVAGGSITFTTRAATRGQLPIYNPASTGPIELQLAPRVSITKANGDPVQVETVLNGSPTATDSGTLKYSLAATYQNLTQAQWEALNLNVRIDYAIDWGRDPKGLSGNIARSRIILPVDKSSNDKAERILGPIALTPRGTLHLTEGAGLTQTYWAFREDLGYGSFRCVTKYSLNQQYTQTFGSLVGTNVPATIADEDGVQVFMKQMLQSIVPPASLDVFTDLRFSGGVTVRNGIAYIGINALRGKTASFPGVPVAVLAAFKAEPETPELRVGAALGTNPRITQTDYARTAQTPSGRTPTQSSLAWANLNVDKENGIIRVESLTVAQRDEITDSISLSQPIGYGAEARPLIYRNPDAEGDRWSPLLWFGLWNGGTVKGAPLVAGSEVFIAADSSLPNILKNGTLGQSGVVWSIDADHPTTGTFAKAITARPWLIQALQITYTNASDPTTFQASPYYRMPQTRGVTFEEWKVRLGQTALGKSTAAGGVAGGDGTVVAWGNQGIYGMGRADFLVADEGRLLRVDSSGNPVANVFGNRFSGVGNGGGAAELRPLVRPVKAYPVGENDLLVVDAGSNRVILMDQDGTALRTLDGMILDAQYKPASYRANDPLTFNDPRDATTYEGYVYKGAQEVVSNQAPVEYWVRYIVADSGNGRIVEMADRYTVDPTTGRIGSPVVDAKGVAQVGVLTWQSPALEGVAKIGTYYNSISRVYVGTLGSGRYVYVAGVSKSRVTRSSAGLDNPNAPSRPSGAGGGAIVVFDPLGGTRVFDRFGLPDLRNTKFLSRTGNYDSANSASYATGLAANTPAQNDRPFSGLMAVTAQTVVDNAGNAAIRAMATDADAVYEFTISAAVLGNANLDPTQNPSGGGSLRPSWMLNEAAYSTLRLASRVSDTNARYFRPMYARRLDSGEILVVNGYRGLAYDGTSFAGDVSLLDGRTFDYGTQNLGFTSSSLQFELPPLTGIRGIVSPVFADRR